MNEALWLQAATAAAVTFAVSMLVILIYQRIQATRAARDGVEVHISPYHCKSALLTKSEQLFYYRLQQAVANEVLICLKVRLADAVDVRGDAIEWQASWNKIAGRSIDFLLVDPATYQPLLAIELEQGGAAGRPHDEWLYGSIQAAGLPVLRIRARRDYDPKALRELISNRMLSVA